MAATGSLSVYGGSMGMCPAEALNSSWAFFQHGLVLDPQGEARNRRINLERDAGSSQALVGAGDNYGVAFSSLNKARGGRFWHWDRTFVVRDSENGLHTVRLNFLERTQAILRCGIGNYLSSGRKIVHLVPPQELDVLVYNAAREALKKNDPILKGIDQQLESESALWLGGKPPTLPIFGLPFLCSADTWQSWWDSARIPSPGLPDLLEKASSANPGVAVDLGCGHSDTVKTLIKKGWNVVAVDYADGILLQLRGEVEQLNSSALQQLTTHHGNIEDYKFPSQVDLVSATSSLTHCNPAKVKGILENIYRSLKPGGYFVGNLFVSQYAGGAKEASRTMGAWFVENEESAGFLLASLGFEIIECKYGGKDDPHSVVFLCRKPLD